MNPVQVAIRDHVDARFREWRIRTEDPVPTRAGARYYGVHLAALLGPPLKAVGLHVREEYGFRIFVTRDGRQITRERLCDLIAGSLDGHPDAVLRASVRSPGFFEHLAYRVPEYAGEEIERTRTPRPAEVTRSATHRTRVRRIREERAETASALAFLAAAARLAAGTRVVASDLYGAAVANIGRKVGETITADEGSEFFTVPRRRVLLACADAVYGPRRRHARGSVYVVPEDVQEVLSRVARMVAGLSLAPETVEALSASGIEDPESFADETVATIGPALGPAGKRPALDPALVEIAAALPFPVAAALASSDAPRRALGLFGREWLRRRPEDREAVSAAAGAFGEPLVEAVRFRVASAIEENT